MKAITRQETIEALKNLFDYEAHKESKEVMVTEENGNAVFMVNKMYLERFEVLDRLQEFFSDKYIDGGQCRIDSITMLYTIIHIEDLEQRAYDTY